MAKSSLKIRFSNPSPSFFKKITNFGLICAGIGGVLVAAPVALPAIVVTAGGYLLTAGGIAAAISKLTVADKSVLPPTE